jgi:hypothetical protein
MSSLAWSPSSEQGRGVYVLQRPVAVKHADCPCQHELAAIHTLTFDVLLQTEDCVLQE